MARVDHYANYWPEGGDVRGKGIWNEPLGRRTACLLKVAKHKNHKHAHYNLGEYVFLAMVP